MTTSSRSSTLASLRCLATLPVHHRPSGASSDVMTCNGNHLGQPACYRARSSVQATHYTAYLQRKVSCAVFSLNKLMRDWDGACAPEAARPGQAPAAPRQSDGGGRPAGGTTTACRPAAPPSAGAASQGASLPVGARKRSASEASLNEPSPSARPPSSSLQHTPRVSDDCGSPSGPADPASQAEGGWDGAGESIAAGPLRDAGPVDSAGPHSLSIGASMQPCGPLPASVSEPLLPSRPGFSAARSQQRQQAQQQPRQPPEAVAAPAAAVGAARNSARQVAPPLHGPEGTCRSAPYNGRICGGGSGGVSSLGGALAPAPPHRRPEIRASCLDIPRLQHGLPPGTHEEAARRSAVAAAAAGGAGAPAHGAAMQQDGRPCSRPPPSLCDLPAPSCTLQQLVSRGCLAERGRLQPLTLHADAPFLHQPQQLMQPNPQQQRRQQSVEAATAEAPREEGGTSAMLGCITGSSRLQAALEATAAATAHHWQRQAVALPPMAALLRRWPLGSLRTQLAGSASVDARDGGFRSSCGGGGGSAAGQGGAPLLRHVQTPLPRRRVAVQLPLRAASQTRQGAAPAADVALPLAVLSEPLPADTCPGRRELWELLLLNLPITTGVGNGRGCGSAADAEALLDAPDVRGGGGASGSWCGCRCCDGGGGQAGEGGAGAVVEQHDGVDAEDAGQDDSDVYISNEGLVCLASLTSASAQASVSSPQPGRGGWRLPFLVRQRPPSDSGAAGGYRCHSNGARCGESRGTGPQCAAGRLPTTLYFAEPLWDSAGLLSDSWARMCATALAAGRSSTGTACAVGHAATGGSAAAAAAAVNIVDTFGSTAPHGAAQGLEEVDVDEEEEDCACCQQDEWQLGGLSLLVLSHCDVGLARGHGSCGEPPVPAHVVALAGAPGLAGGAAARQAATQAAVDAAAGRYAELACRAELMLSSHAATLVAVVDPADGALSAQQCLDRGALLRLATERNAQAHCWRLVHDLLSELRRLPPGPYMLCMDAAAQALELRGVGRGE